MNRESQMKTVNAWFGKHHDGPVSDEDCNLLLSLVFGQELNADQQARVVAMQTELQPTYKPSVKEAVAKHVAKHLAAKKTISESPLSEDEGVSILNKLFNGEVLTADETAKVNAIADQQLVTA